MNDTPPSVAKCGRTTISRRDKAAILLVLGLYLVQLGILAADIHELNESNKIWSRVSLGRVEPSFSLENLGVMLAKGAGSGICAVLGMIGCLGSPKGAPGKWPLFIAGLVLWLVMSFLPVFW